MANPQLGHCGPVARPVARAVRAVLPLRGVQLPLSVIMGSPDMSAPCIASTRVGSYRCTLDLREANHRSLYLNLVDIELRKVVLALLRPGDTVIDIGANIGFWTLLAAAQGCRVVACEPVPSTRELLVRNVKANALDDRVEVLGVAMSDVSGQEVAISVPTIESGHASLVTGYLEGVEEVTVTTAVLDDLLDRAPIRFLKIDVEGHEPSVLRGADKMLSSGTVDYVMIELVEPHLQRSHSSVAEVCATMEGYGYTLHRWVKANEGLHPKRDAVTKVSDIPPIVGDGVFVRQALAGTTG